MAAEEGERASLMCQGWLPGQQAEARCTGYEAMAETSVLPVLLPAQLAAVAMAGCVAADGCRCGQVWLP